MRNSRMPLNPADPSRKRYIAALREIQPEGVSIEELQAKHVPWHIAHLRWRAWDRLRRDGFGMKAIGRRAGKHHTTIMHGLRQLEIMEAANDRC